MPATRRFRPLLATTTLLLCSSFSPVAVTWAQTPPQATADTPDGPPTPRFFLPLLQNLNYDAATRGPLLMVAPPVTFEPAVPLPLERAALPTIAEAAKMRVVSAGRISVLVPLTMTLLNDKPGKANPFAGMHSGETLKLLLASFTSAQWQAAGGANGIGLGELTDDQRLLWDALIAPRLILQKSTLKPGSEPNSWEYTDTRQTEVSNRDAIRLRLNKKVHFEFSKQGAEDYSWSGNPDYGSKKAGDVEYSLSSITTDPDGSTTYHSGMSGGREDQPNSVFGVPLILEQPRRLKPGQVDFAAPSLDAMVSLTGFPVRPSNPAPPLSADAPPEAEQYRREQEERNKLPTVGQLLARISKATGWDFLPDKRLRDLPVYLRGDSARAGDLLMALAWSVAGAYRKMEPAGTGKDMAPLYLLTEDVAGIGTRIARLADWGQEADEAKRRIMESQDARTAKNDPLSALSFASGDKYALSADLTKKIEDGWRAKKYAAAPEVKFNDLSPALREAVQRFADDRVKDDNGTVLRTDRVRIGEELGVVLLVPGASGETATIPAWELSQNIGSQYLQQIAFDPSKTPEKKPATPTATAPLSPLGFASPRLKGQRRILIARPDDAGQVPALVRAAASRGLHEIWLETDLRDMEAAGRLLTAATKAAGGRPIVVGSVVHLLKNGPVKGEPERNIFGETGEEFRARLLQKYDPKNTDTWYQNRFAAYTGWTAPGESDLADLTRRLRTLAAVPGLGGLTLRATGAPGWTGEKPGGDGIWMNGALGYTPTQRRAFLRAYGIDPIDIPESHWTLSPLYAWQLGFFDDGQSEGESEIVPGKAVPRPADLLPRKAWWAFRKRQNDQMLANLFRAIKKDRPALPLYLDNRISGYAHANTDWFGTWDAADRLPDSSLYYVESEIRAQARRTSRAIFAHWGWWWTNADAIKSDAPATFARRVTDAALRNSPPNWNGLVLDMTSVPTDALLPLLNGLPTAPMPTTANR